MLEALSFRFYSDIHASVFCTGISAISPPFSRTPTRTGSSSLPSPLCNSSADVGRKNIIMHLT